MRDVRLFFGVFPQPLKPLVSGAFVAARLKSCPVTRPILDSDRRTCQIWKFGACSQATDTRRLEQTNVVEPLDFDLFSASDLP